MNIIPTSAAGAYRLLGKTLTGGWVVTERMGWDVQQVNGVEHAVRDGKGSGGCFSVAYKVTHPARGDAFMKAIDLSWLGKDDFFSAIQQMNSVVGFERTVLEKCEMARLDRVAYALEYGQFTDGTNVQDIAPYFIFSLAEGDVRRQRPKINQSAYVAWACRALHHAAVGLFQLHKNDLGHRDSKPSNLLDFGSDKGFKVADLGCAAVKGVEALRDSEQVPGDPNYAAPEHLYGLALPEWQDRVLACDAYLFGSLICYFFLGLGMTTMVLQKLENEHRPKYIRGLWDGTFADVLPHWRSAMSEIMLDLEDNTPVEVREMVVMAVRHLCEPDPKLRGHPHERARQFGNPYSLERYISLFDLAAKKAARVPVPAQ